MIIPADIKGRKSFKIRNAKIINDWLLGKTQEDLAKEHSITRMAVYYVIRKNREILKLDKEFAKVQRVHYLNHALANSSPTGKDRLDILEAMRKEYEGDSVTTVVTQFLQVEKSSDIPANNRLNHAV